MEFNRRSFLGGGMIALSAALVGGCCVCCKSDGGSARTGEDVFTWFANEDIGRAGPSEPGDFYVLRYEKPAKEPFDDWRKSFGPKWDFVEVRQLKDSVTTVTDGVLAETKRRVPGCD